MDTTILASFAFLAILLVVSPGPNGVLLAKTVPTSGKAAGFANVAGFLVAFYIHDALSVLGISLILLQSAYAFFIVKLLGAVYLCWLGAKALYDAWKGAEKTNRVAPAKNKRTLTKAFFEGLLTNALNPKVSMFYLAAFPQFISASHGSISTSFMLVSIHAVLNFIWFSMIVLLFHKFSKVARSGTIQRWIKGLTGVIFISFGLKLATLRT